MAVPVATVVAQGAAQLLQRARQRPESPSSPPPKRRGPIGLIATVLAAVVLLPCLVVVVLLGGAQQAAGCSPAAPLPGTWTGPGSLGGVAGTGVSAAEIRSARAIAGRGGTRLTPGTYSPTAYFPHPNAPSTNCGASCVATASGIRVNNATRRAYLIASNPRLNQYGALAYIWPNPYGWTGPFVVADTGSDFTGTGRLDFYIFMNTGESWQSALGRAYQWGPANQVRISAAAIRAGGPSISGSPLGPGPADLQPAGAPAPLADTPGDDPAGGCGDPVAAGELGELSGTPEQIVNRVVLYANGHGFPDVSVQSVRAANDRHSPLTSSNNPSDHKGPPDHAWAADISNGALPTPAMDELAATIASAFGIAWEGAGLINHTSNGYRMQLIYRAAEHYDHVHFGVKALVSAAARGGRRARGAHTRRPSARARAVSARRRPTTVGQLQRSSTAHRASTGARQ